MHASRRAVQVHRQFNSALVCRLHQSCCKSKHWSRHRANTARNPNRTSSRCYAATQPECFGRSPTRARSLSPRLASGRACRVPMPSPARLERLHERLTSFGQGQQWQRCLNLLTACSSESITIKTLRVTGNRQYGPNLTRLQCMATGSCLRDCVRGKQKPIPKEMFHSVLFPTTISYNIAMASAWGRKAKAGRKKETSHAWRNERDRQTDRPDEAKQAVLEPQCAVEQHSGACP